MVTALRQLGRQEQQNQADAVRGLTSIIYYQALDIPRVWFSLSCIDKVALGQEVLVSVLESLAHVYLPMEKVQGQKSE